MKQLPAIFLLLWLSIQRSHAIPVPNGQLGNVEIECGEKTIEAVFLTEAPFEGRIFVIGHAHEPKCVTRDVGRRSTSILINKDECGVVTTRSSDPNGLFSTVKIMISFHTDFITKVDRGYEISCFYMAADKTVTYPLTVATQDLAGITEIAEMPRCRYEVIDPESRQQAEVVTVGSKLLHRWICESTAPDLWCMTVHSCRVEDGSGTQFEILDETGCSIDRYLLDNLEYGPGDLQAQKEAHAFKFADKVVVNFQCSVRLDIKDGECPTPLPSQPRPNARPSAPSITTRRPFRTTTRGATTRRPQVFHRGKRHSGVANEIPISLRDLHESFEIDVRAAQIDVLDPLTDFGVLSSSDSLRHLTLSPSSDCLSRHTVAAFASAAVALIISLIALIIILAMKPRNKVQ